MLILSIHSMLKTYKSKSICLMAMRFKCHKKYRTSSREIFERWVILFRLLIILPMLRSRGKLRSIIMWKRCNSCTLKRWTNCWHLKMTIKMTMKQTKIKICTKKWKIPGILKRKSSNRNPLKSSKIILTWSTSWEVAIWQEGRMLLLKIRNLLIIMVEMLTLNLNRFLNPSIRSKLKLKNNLKMTKKIINNTTLRTKDRTEE